MTLPSPVQTWLEEQGFSPVVSVRPVGGGCINNGARVVTLAGQSFFLKTNAHCPPDMFVCEAEGLAALTTSDGPRVPKVFLHGVDFLLLEDLRPAQSVRDYWEVLGQQMAALHQHTSSQFGFSQDNYIGSTRQPNPIMEDGYSFFAEHRLGYQAALASSRGLLSPKEVKQIERIGTRLPDLIPPQPASILHGDLWSGNIISDELGYPALIDPATHYGWAEADLAMMTLFGSPPEEFFRVYQETRPLQPGLKKRFPIYNLYHLLNHLNLFGRGYYGQVMAFIQRLA